MHGGLTGFGYGKRRHYPMGHTLGGLLLGGAKLSDMDPQSLEHAKQLERNRRARERAAAKKAALAEAGFPAYARGVPRGYRMHLKHLIDAENSASALERQAGHPDYADWLHRDAGYNTALFDSKKAPAWLKHKYASESDWFPSGRAGTAMSVERKALLKSTKEALRGAQKFLYTNSRGTKKIIKEGSSAYNAAIRTKWVQTHGDAVLHPIA
jgi:hypothetical protein